MRFTWLSRSQFVELQSPFAANALEKWIVSLHGAHRAGREFFRDRAKKAPLGSTMGKVASTLAEVRSDRWLWAYFIIRSRAFNCELPQQDGGEATISEFHTSNGEQTCLIPIIDLANADPQSTNDNTMVLTMPAKRAYYSVRAQKSMKRGQEVLQNYAGKPAFLSSTMHYLMFYGFIDDNLNNGYGDFITVEVDVHSTDAKNPIWSIRSDGIVPQGLVAASGLSAQDLLGALATAAQAALNAAPTSLEGDLQRLREENLGGWRRATLLFRIRYKLILQLLVTDDRSPARLADRPRSPPKITEPQNMPSFSMYQLTISGTE